MPPSLPDLTRREWGETTVAAIAILAGATMALVGEPLFPDLTGEPRAGPVLLLLGIVILTVVAAKEKGYDQPWF